MAVPGAPVIRARNTGAGLIRLSWPAVEGATGYNLYRGTSAAAAGVLGLNEKQTVTIDATGGDFTITYAGQETGAIAFDAAAQAVEDALVALSNIALGDVDVTKVGAVYTIEFTGLLARTNVAEVTTDDSGLTGGASTAVVATTVAGVAAHALTVTSPYHDAVSDDTFYWYTVRAKNAEGEGAASNVVQVRSTVLAADDADIRPTGVVSAIGSERSIFG